MECNFSILYIVKYDHNILIMIIVNVIDKITFNIKHETASKCVCFSSSGTKTVKFYKITFFSKALAHLCMVEVKIDLFLQFGT